MNYHESTTRHTRKITENRKYNDDELELIKRKTVDYLESIVTGIDASDVKVVRNTNNPTNVDIIISQELADEIDEYWNHIREKYKEL